MSKNNRWTEAMMKTVDGVEHPASAFLVVEDPEKPDTWHLRVKDADGNIDHRLMGAAWAALHEGFRGNKYEGPDKAKALARLKKIYKDEDMDLPGTQEALSLDQKRMQIENKARAKFESQGSTAPVDAMDFWVREIFDDDNYIVAHVGAKHYKITYKMDGDDIVFAERDDWEIVEERTDWVKVSEYFEAKISPAKDDVKGREWDITLIGPRSDQDLVTIDEKEYLRSLNGRLYLVEALEQSVPMWEGVKVYDNHLTDKEFAERGGMRSIADEWLGVVTKPKWHKKERKLTGVLKVADRRFAEKMLDAHNNGILDAIGLSIDTFPIEAQVMHEGNLAPAMVGFQRINSLDVVAEPAAGGGFNRLIAAAQTNQEKNAMDPKELQSLIARLVAEALATNKIGDAAREALETAIFNAATSANVKEATDAEAFVKPLATAMVVQAMAEEPPADGGPEPNQDPPANTPPASEAEGNTAQRLEALERKIRADECRNARIAAVSEAKLPPAMANLVEGAYPDGQVWDIEKMRAFVNRAKEAQAAGDPSGRVAEGGQRASVSHDQHDKMEAEFLRLVAGNNAFRQLEQASEHFVTERIPESYRAWISAGRPNYGVYSLKNWAMTMLGGDPFVDQRAYEAVTTSGMTSIVKNALNVMLAANYARRHRWWDPIVTTEEVDTIDQATLVRVYGLNTLAVVGEGQAYQELAWDDDEETAEFVKKGNYVGVTLEALLRDKVNVIRSLPDRLSTSWYNTLSRLVSNVFTLNSAAGPVLSDTGALFNATAATTFGGHANLLTTALSHAAYSAARTAMRKQTDQALGVGERLLATPKHLLVPVDLETTALAIRNSELVPEADRAGTTGNQTKNQFQGQFEPLVVPSWTDTNDWALVADKGEFPAIWLIFLRGRMVPELFSSDSEVAGAMFTNDTLRYKVRMLTFRFSDTYDCAPVSDFRPLHKSNV